MPSNNKRINLTVSEDVYEKIKAYKVENGISNDASACLQLVVKQLNANEESKKLLEFMQRVPLEDLQKISNIGLSQILDIQKNKTEE